MVISKFEQEQVEKPKPNMKRILAYVLMLPLAASCSHTPLRQGEKPIIPTKDLATKVMNFSAAHPKAKIYYMEKEKYDPLYEAMSKFNQGDPFSIPSFADGKLATCLIAMPSDEFLEGFFDSGIKAVDEARIKIMADFPRGGFAAFSTEHEMWHCEFWQHTDITTREELKKFVETNSNINFAESFADIGYAATAIRRGEHGIIENVIDFRILEAVIAKSMDNHYTVDSLVALQDKIDDMGLDSFKKMPDKDISKMLYNIALENHASNLQMLVVSRLKNVVNDDNRLDPRTAMNKTVFKNENDKNTYQKIKKTAINFFEQVDRMKIKFSSVPKAPKHKLENSTRPRI